jgi:hypothetical protein
LTQSSNVFATGLLARFENLDLASEILDSLLRGLEFLLETEHLLQGVVSLLPKLPGHLPQLSKALLKIWYRLGGSQNRNLPAFLLPPLPESPLQTKMHQGILHAHQQSPGGDRVSQGVVKPIRAKLLSQGFHLLGLQTGQGHGTRSKVS